MPSLDEFRAQLAEAKKSHRRLEDEAARVRARIEAGDDREGLKDRAANPARAIDRHDLEIAQLEGEAAECAARTQRLLEIAEDPERRETASFRVDDGRQEQSRGPADRLRSQALSANERADFLPADAREHMARTIERDDDPNGLLSRYVVEASNRDYFRAFSKWLRDTQSGGHEWTPQEREAVQRVRWLERSLTLGGSGGFLVPYELDPNIIISSTGYVDPMRQVSRVETTAYNEKRFVTSQGVVSNWYAEEAEVSDDAPTLLQPAITCRKAMSFVPVSFELYEDSDIAQQIANLFADAKAAHEANAFTLGTGTAPQPKGIITAVSAVGGSVIATGTNALASADPYNNQNALPARWRSRAVFMANLSIVNGFRQLPKATNIQESLVDDSTTPPKLAGWSLYENNAMDGTLTAAAADYALLSGDFQQYAVVDRIGSSIEVVPNLFGASRRPTGQRGFLLHWRVGADVLIADAFRLTNYST
jgi:HK97 family phage major capsid protein